MPTSARDDVGIVPYKMRDEIYPKHLWLGGKSPSQPFCILEVTLWNGCWKYFFI